MNIAKEQIIKSIFYPRISQQDRDDNDILIHGCIIQLPLPSHINPKIVNLINIPKNDNENLISKNSKSVV